MGMPQRPQKRVPRGYVCPQRAQLIVCGSGCAGRLTWASESAAVSVRNEVLPPLPQNVTPSAHRAWQFVHTTPPCVTGSLVVRLARLPPRDGVKCSLEAALLSCV